MRSQSTGSPLLRAGALGELAPKADFRFVPRSTAEPPRARSLRLVIAPSDRSQGKAPLRVAALIKVPACRMDLRLRRVGSQLAGWTTNTPLHEAVAPCCRAAQAPQEPRPAQTAALPETPTAQRWKEQRSSDIRGLPR